MRTHLLLLGFRQGFTAPFSCPGKLAILLVAMISGAASLAALAR